MVGDVEQVNIDHHPDPVGYSWEAQQEVHPFLVPAELPQMSENIVEVRHVLRKLE